MVNTHLIYSLRLFICDFYAQKKKKKLICFLLGFSFFISFPSKSYLSHIFHYFGCLCRSIKMSSSNCNNRFYFIISSVFILYIGPNNYGCVCVCVCVWFGIYRNFDVSDRLLHVRGYCLKTLNSKLSRFIIVHFMANKLRIYISLSSVWMISHTTEDLYDWSTLIYNLLKSLCLQLFWPLATRNKIRTKITFAYKWTIKNLYEHLFNRITIQQYFHSCHFLKVNERFVDVHTFVTFIFRNNLFCNHCTQKSVWIV